MLPEKKVLEGIVEGLQQIMRIQDWDITLEILNSKEMDATAKRDYIPGGNCSRNWHYKTATISINKDWDEINEEWYMVIVHEMHHILLDELDQYYTKQIDEAIEEELRSKIEEGFDFEIEKLNCRLTRSFINAYPISNFIKEGCVDNGQGIIKVQQG